MASLDQGHDDVSSGRVSVLFVCLGNICRSPLAEGIFASLADARGLADRFRVDSAGTGDWHIGRPPDPRTIAVASAHGIRLDGVARQVTPEDFDAFDVIVAMDRSNRRALARMSGDSARDGRATIVMMRDSDPESGGADVPDPYFGGAEGFDRVYAILERACAGLLGGLAGDGSM